MIGIVATERQALVAEIDVTATIKRPDGHVIRIKPAYTEAAVAIQRDSGIVHGAVAVQNNDRLVVQLDRGMTRAAVTFEYERGVAIGLDFCAGGRALIFEVDP